MECDCDDGDPCTKNTCVGMCITSQIENCCQTNNDCTGTLCNQAICITSRNRCVLQPYTNGVACNDQNVCTVNDGCTGGFCMGQHLNCTTIQCQVCTCDPALGCMYTNVVDGSLCQQDTCTVSTCISGQCSGEPMDCSHLDNHCGLGQCVGGECVHVPGTDGTLCDDGLQCTSSDHCESGTCVGVQRQCFDNDPCTHNKCIEEVGTCLNVPVDSQTCETTCFYDSDCANKFPWVADNIQCRDGSCVSIDNDPATYITRQKLSILGLTADSITVEQTESIRTDLANVLSIEPNTVSILRISDVPAVGSTDSGTSRRRLSNGIEIDYEVRTTDRSVDTFVQAQLEQISLTLLQTMVDSIALSVGVDAATLTLSATALQRTVAVIDPSTTITFTGYQIHQCYGSLYKMAMFFRIDTPVQQYEDGNRYRVAYSPEHISGSFPTGFPSDVVDIQSHNTAEYGMTTFTLHTKCKDLSQECYQFTNMYYAFSVYLSDCVPPAWQYCYAETLQLSMYFNLSIVDCPLRNYIAQTALDGYLDVVPKAAVRFNQPVQVSLSITDGFDPWMTDVRICIPNQKHLEKCVLNTATQPCPNIGCFDWEDTESEALENYWDLFVNGIMTSYATATDIVPCRRPEDYGKVDKCGIGFQGLCTTDGFTVTPLFLQEYIGRQVVIDVQFSGHFCGRRLNSGTITKREMSIITVV